jgi:hypothetical protein
MPAARVAVVVGLAAACGASSSAASSSPSAASTVTTVVGIPEIVGGPTCCMFDSPFLALRLPTTNTVVGFTANSNTFLYTNGTDVSSYLNPPLDTGLDPDPSTSSYSHCGKWMNSAVVDPDDNSTIHAFYHQEWKCDYSDGGYTNKSVAYAVSTDGGRTFVPTPAPSADDPAANQIIAGWNTTSVHQTGEGDHGVVLLGDYLYLFFIEWDSDSSIHGGTSSGVARSALSDRGRPGTWWKYFNNSWTSPGVGGKSDTVNLPGTAVYNVPAVNALVAVGVIFSASLNVAWSADAVTWEPAAAGPLFTAGWSSWDRNANSSELFGYPALTGVDGTTDGLPTTDSFVYATYLSPGQDFSHRWLVRRPLGLFVSAAAAAAASSSPSSPTGPPPALASLGLWVSNSTPARTWATTGPVAPDSGPGYARPSAAIALLVTWAPPSPPGPQLVEVQECRWAGGGGGFVVALTRFNECGAPGSAFAAGAVLRTSGWVAQSAADADGLGWGQVAPPAREEGKARAAVVGATSGALWRCVRGAGTAAVDYAATFADPSCTSAGPGYAPDVLLGYALSPLG